jgi:hypothetical protein
MADTEADMTTQKVHSWTHPISIAYMPGDNTAALDLASSALLDWLRDAGCTVTDLPENSTDLIITTRRFGDNVSRDEALLFNAKRQYRLSSRPQVLTLVDVPEDEYQSLVQHFTAIAQLPEDEANREQYPGLGPQAADIIAHQARRGGPELAFARLVQGQVLSIRVMALRTQAGRPYRAMHFDMAGARPVTDATDLEIFAEDAGARVLAAVCAVEVNHHSFVDDPVSAELWDSLSSPDVMVRAGSMFTQFGFFTTPLYVEKLLGYRGVSDAISAQFSEGCYAIYEPDIPGLLTTASGSSRLVDKRSISRLDQAVVVGTRPDHDGAMVRPVTGMDRVVPSVEAVEMMGLCERVSKHRHLNSHGLPVTVPNVRAILHGHLGVAAYDPQRVETVMLDPLFYSQLVSCGTGALAEGTATAFARSESLKDLHDPRRVIFLEQPGHGVMVVEKWPASDDGTGAFDTIHDYLSSGVLQMTLDIAQGLVRWEMAPGPDGHSLMRRITEPELAF